MCLGACVEECTASNKKLSADSPMKAKESFPLTSAVVRSWNGTITGSVWVDPGSKQAWKRTGHCTGAGLCLWIWFPDQGAGIVPLHCAARIIQRRCNVAINYCPYARCLCALMLGFAEGMGPESTRPRVSGCATAGGTIVLVQKII